MIELRNGNLNSVSLVEGRGSRLLVVRRPKAVTDVARTMVQVFTEHAAEGFFDNPSSQIRLRSPLEQVIFAQKLRQQSVPTPAVFLGKRGEQLLDYVPDADDLFDLWLKQDLRAPHASSKILKAVMMAHEEDLVLGDSTGKNELVTKDADIVLIDFDIELLGTEAREFEFANLIYRLSRAAHRGGYRQLPVLGEVCKNALLGVDIRRLYDQNVLLKYLQQFIGLSSPRGMERLNGMTPLVQPKYSAELFTFLADVLKYSMSKSK